MLQNTCIAIGSWCIKTWELILILYLWYIRSVTVVETKEDLKSTNFSHYPGKCNIKSHTPKYQRFNPITKCPNSISLAIGIDNYLGPIPRNWTQHTLEPTKTPYHHNNHLHGSHINTQHTNTLTKGPPVRPLYTNTKMDHLQQDAVVVVPQPSFVNWLWFTYELTAMIKVKRSSFMPT